MNDFNLQLQLSYLSVPAVLIGQSVAVMSSLPVWISAHSAEVCVWSQSPPLTHVRWCAFSCLWEIVVDGVGALSHSCDKELHIFRVYVIKSFAHSSFNPDSSSPWWEFCGLPSFQESACWWTVSWGLQEGAPLHKLQRKLNNQWWFPLASLSLFLSLSLSVL